MKKLDVMFENWDHTCGDGCCYTWGTDVYINGEMVTRFNSDEFGRVNIIELLTFLGYTVSEFDFDDNKVV